MFAHIVVFLSFIYAIAITHPLASGHELIVERRRVRWSGLLTCWMIAGVLLLVLNWLAIFRLSSVTTWTVGQVLVHILGAVCIYFTCAFPAMRAQPGETIDMPAYFARNRVPILGAFALFGVVALLVNFIDFRTGGPAAEGAIDRMYRIMPNIVAEAVGLIFRATWVQWLVVIFVLGRLAYVMTMSIVAG